MLASFRRVRMYSVSFHMGSAVSVAAMRLMFPFSLMVKRVRAFASSLMTNKARCSKEACEANAEKQRGCKSLDTDSKSY